MADGVVPSFNYFVEYGTEEKTGFPIGTEIQILQAESGDTGDVLIGFMVGEDEGICLLQEIELID